MDYRVGTALEWAPKKYMFQKETSYILRQGGD